MALLSLTVVYADSSINYHTAGPGGPCMPVNPLCPFMPLSPASPASPLSPRSPVDPCHKEKWQTSFGLTFLACSSIQCSFATNIVTYSRATRSSRASSAGRASRSLENWKKKKFYVETGLQWLTAFVFDWHDIPSWNINEADLSLTVSPRSPVFPAGPTGPGAPGGPGAPEAPAGPLSPRSP